MSLYFLSQSAQALARRLSEAIRGPAREFDPIDHPAIAAMGLAELADLPLSPPRPHAPAARAADSASARKAA